MVAFRSAAGCFLDKIVKNNKETQKIVKKSDTETALPVYNTYRIQKTAPASRININLFRRNLPCSAI